MAGIFGKLCPLFLGIASLGVPAAAFAQAPDAPIESAFGLWEDEAVMDRVEALFAGGESLDVAETRAALRKPTGARVESLPPRTVELAGAEIARHARDSYLRLGWYGGTDESDLGLALGAAFAVAEDTFATCRHVVAPTGMTVGCLVAIDPSGAVYPVQAIVAADRTSDVAIVRVEGTNRRPIALAADVAPGDRVYCYSEPLDVYGYFDEGIVNRFYRLPPPARRKVAPDAASLIRMHVSVDWAPGSSGSPTLDRFGNATGLVSAIQTLSEDYPFIPYDEPEMEIPKEGETDPTAPAPPDARTADDPAKDPPFEGAAEEETPKKKRRRREPAPTLMVLHEATPAKSILDLLAKTREAAANPQEPGDSPEPESNAPAR